MHTFRFFKRWALLFGLAAASLGVKGQTLYSDTATSFKSRFELGEAYHQGTFLITPYKPVYLLPGVWSNNPNVAPQSGNPDYNWELNDIPLDAVESKFQLSFKTKIAQGLFFGHGDVWMAYTQTSHWQVYNAERSRPFRESNYEPEAFLLFATSYRVLGFEGSMLGMSFNHQSNGRARPLSRSWNRLIFMVGFDRPGWMVHFRPWIRIPDGDDENPEITRTLGNGELIVAHERNGHHISAITRATVHSGYSVIRSIQLDYAFPLFGRLRGHIQAFHGYGESMIDFNHRQTTVGAGVSLMEWF